MRIILFIILPLLCLVSSCKTQKETSKTVTIMPPPPPPPPPKDDGDSPKGEPMTYRLTISFYSIGTGIDSEHHDKFVEFLNNFKPVLLYDKAGWGREGEVDYCFFLRELKPKEQETFVADVKKLLEKCERFHLEEFKPCKNKK